MLVSQKLVVKFLSLSIWNLTLNSCYSRIVTAWKSDSSNFSSMGLLLLSGRLVWPSEGQSSGVRSKTNMKDSFMHWTYVIWMPCLPDVCLDGWTASDRSLYKILNLSFSSERSTENTCCRFSYTTKWLREKCLKVRIRVSLFPAEDVWKHSKCQASGHGLQNGVVHRHGVEGCMKLNALSASWSRLIGRLPFPRTWCKSSAW